MVSEYTFCQSLHPTNPYLSFPTHKTGSVYISNHTLISALLVFFISKVPHRPVLRARARSTEPPLAAQMADFVKYSKCMFTEHYRSIWAAPWLGIAGETIALCQCWERPVSCHSAPSSLAISVYTDYDRPEEGCSVFLRLWKTSASNDFEMLLVDRVR